MNRGEEIQEKQQTKQVRKFPIVAFFVGSAVSYVGDMFTLLAIPWFVLQTTGSVTKTGITAFFSTLPMVFSAFFGSTLVDRLGYKRTSVIGDIASGVTVMLIPFLQHTVGLTFWQLLGLVFLGGLLKSPGTTARRAMVPELADLAAMPLERANALSDGINRVAGLIGAPLAGVLIVIIGTSNLLWLDAASFAISSALIGIAVPVTSAKPKENEDSYLKAVLQGVHFIQKDTLILSLVVVILITNMIDGAFFSVVEPTYIKHIFNSAVPLGLIVAASGGSAFIGTLLFAAIGHRLPRHSTFAIGYILGGAFTFWIFLFLPLLPFLIAWQIIAGLAIGSVNPIFSTVVQERVPPEMRARVFGTIGAGALAGIPFGTFVIGYVVAGLGLQMTLLAMGALYLVTTLSLLVNPVMKEMNKAALQDSEEEVVQ